MTNYTIWIDDKPYRGEGTSTEPAPAVSGGWYDRGPETVSGILIGGSDPHVIEGRRNLRSHIDRIVRRIGADGFAPSEVVIRVHGIPREGFCTKCEHPVWDLTVCPNCQNPVAA